MPGGVLGVLRSYRERLLSFNVTHSTRIRLFEKQAHKTYVVPFALCAFRFGTIPYALARAHAVLARAAFVSLPVWNSLGRLCVPIALSLLPCV